MCCDSSNPIWRFFCLHPFIQGDGPWLPGLSTARKAIMMCNFNCCHPATRAKYLANNVFGSLLYTKSESLDTWLPNSNYIRPGIYATNPCSQVSNKETFCPRQGEKLRPFWQPDFSPRPRAANTYAFVLARSGRQARDFSPSCQIRNLHVEFIQIT